MLELLWVDQGRRTERAPGDYPLLPILQLKTPKPVEGQAFILGHTAG